MSHSKFQGFVDVFFRCDTLFQCHNGLHDVRSWLHATSVFSHLINEWHQHSI